jgi:hypothetical protein
MNLVKRLKAPSPKFFTVLRNIGLALAALGGTILAAPIALPLMVTAVGGYLAVAGGVLTAVSQLTTVAEEGPEPSEGFGFAAGLPPDEPSLQEAEDRLSPEEVPFGTGSAPADYRTDEFW